MSDVTQILLAIEEGNPSAAEQLLPLVYEELRKLASIRLAAEKPGQTLQATALVHEAYMRLVDGENARHWDSIGHFFAAAAEAMRRILVDNARRRASLKRGGNHLRRTFAVELVAGREVNPDLLALNEALEKLALRDRQAAELVKLRYFAGLTSQESADCLGFSARTADRVWAYARSFLLAELLQDQ